MKFHLPKVQCQKNQHGTSLLASLQTQSETFTLPVKQILFKVDATFIQLSLILSFLNHRISMISPKKIKVMTSNAKIVLKVEPPSRTHPVCLPSVWT